MVNQKDDHKGLGLWSRFLRYLFANILLALRAPGALSCGKQQPISGTAFPPRFEHHRCALRGGPERRSFPENAEKPSCMRAPECPFYSGDRFLAGFPNNFAQEAWFAADHVLPFEWMFETWGAPA